MSSTVWHLIASGISIVAGLCFLGISVFLRQWFVEGGLLRKKYYGDDGRVFYAMLGMFFIFGGIAFLVTK